MIKKNRKVLILITTALVVIIALILIIFKPFIIINHKVYSTYSKEIEISIYDNNFDAKELQRLKYMKNLKKLDLFYEDITDLTFLNNVSSLEYFTLHNISPNTLDWSPIAKQKI